MSTAKNLVYYGPPGTGKTYEVAREAVRIIDGKVDEASFQGRYLQLLDAGRIWFITFHPSYSYEDFIEGYRPRQSLTGGIVYDLEDGPFKQACSVAEPSALFSVGEKLPSAGSKEYEVIHVDKCGVAVKSENIRTDAVTPEVIQYSDFWTINHMKSNGVSPQDLSVAGTKPEERTAVAKKTSIPTTVLTNSSPMRAVWESLEKKLAEKKEVPVVLIIDEINRADLSRVFGELMTLLEHDKRRGGTDERSVILPYSKKPFSVPASLSVLGTMNTADRSLAHMDVALRRRFEFILVPSRPDLCPKDYGGIDIALVLQEWNRRISALLSADYLIGHAELMEEKLEALRKSMGWNDSVNDRLRAFALTMRRKVLPLLLDYFHADWKQAALVLGSDFGSGKEGLLKQVTYDDLQDKAGDVISVRDFSSYEIPLWWDPTSSSWNEKMFKSAMSLISPAI